ncbi:hypothetical protein, partial [Sulfoacidibacillus thermotolerans]
MVLRKSALFILAVAATSVMSIGTSYAATVPLNFQITLTKSQVQRGTNLGSNWTYTLNSNQSYYTYSVMPNPTPSDVFVDTAT